MKRLSILLFAALSACSTSPADRMERRRNAHGEWPAGVREEVLRGHVNVGMTPDMVYIAWGRPTHARTDSLSHETVWRYIEEDIDGFVEQVDEVTFLGGVVVKAVRVR